MGFAQWQWGHDNQAQLQQEQVDLSATLLPHQVHWLNNISQSQSGAVNQGQASNGNADDPPSYRTRLRFQSKLRWLTSNVNGGNVDVENTQLAVEQYLESRNKQGVAPNQAALSTPAPPVAWGTPNPTPTATAWSNNAHVQHQQQHVVQHQQHFENTTAKSLNVKNHVINNEIQTHMSKQNHILDQLLARSLSNSAADDAATHIDSWMWSMNVNKQFHANANATTNNWNAMSGWIVNVSVNLNAWASSSSTTYAQPVQHQHHSGDGKFRIVRGNDEREYEKILNSSRIGRSETIIWTPWLQVQQNSAVNTTSSSVLNNSVNSQQMPNPSPSRSWQNTFRAHWFDLRDISTSGTGKNTWNVWASPAEPLVLEPLAHSKSTPSRYTYSQEKEARSSGSNELAPLSHSKSQANLHNSSVASASSSSASWSSSSGSGASSGSSAHFVQVQPAQSSEALEKTRSYSYIPPEFWMFDEDEVVEEPVAAEKKHEPVSFSNAASSSTSSSSSTSVVASAAVETQQEVEQKHAPVEAASTKEPTASSKPSKDTTTVVSDEPKQQAPAPAPQWQPQPETSSKASDAMETESNFSDIENMFLDSLSPMKFSKWKHGSSGLGDATTIANTHEQYGVSSTWTSSTAPSRSNSKLSYTCSTNVQTNTYTKVTMLSPEKEKPSDSSMDTSTLLVHFHQ